MKNLPFNRHQTQSILLPYISFEKRNADQLLLNLSGKNAKSCKTGADRIKKYHQYQSAEKRHENNDDQERMANLRGNATP